MAEPTHISVTLHPDAVVAPALRAVEQSVDMVSFYMQSLEEADLSKPPEYISSRFQMTFAGRETTAEERKKRYTNWVLSKGFQDLARGVRGTLEEAYFYIKIRDFLVKNASRKTTLSTLQEQIKEFRKQAEQIQFPALMEAVNKGLASPLHFEKEFLSLQKVRNCLEHRDGVVGERDVDKSTSLKLSLPQLTMYGEKDGRRKELGKGSFVEKDTAIFFKNEIREREFKLGEHIVFQPTEFHDIGFGCWAFAQDLGSKLPQITESNEATEVSPVAPKRHKVATLKARLPHGLADRAPAEIATTRRMLETIRIVFERYGFGPVETPQIEYTDALGKFLPDQDRPNEGVFSFQDDDEQWLSLRYDLTAPLARYVAENFDALPKPYRSYRYGYVYRNEKPGPGRFRQFMQFDADTVGAASMAADAEVCMMIADTMEELGIPRGSYVVKVNNRKVLDGVMEAIGIGGEENSGKRLTVLRAIDKLDRLGRDGVRLLLGPGRKDESGDYTKGAELSDAQIEKIIWFTLDSNRTATPSEAERRLYEDTREGAASKLYDSALIADWREHSEDHSIICEGIDELEAISKLCVASGYGTRRVRIAPDVVRGLEYYTGPVFEVELTFPVEGDDGKPVRFGSVAGGGRYDGLVGRFRGENIPATGISIGVSRLMAALQHLKKIDTQPEPGPVVVTVFDPGRIADYQKMVASLRSAGIRAELYLGGGKLGAQTKYADKRRSPCTIVQGPDEAANRQVQINDLILGASISQIKDRDEYLKKKAEAQRAVPEDQLVDEVRKLLAKHGVAWE